MDQKLKERLFGLAVLVSVGVLVYPFLTLEKPKPRLVLVPDMPAVQEDLAAVHGVSETSVVATDDLSSEIERLQKELDSLDKSETNKESQDLAHAAIPVIPQVRPVESVVSPAPVVKPVETPATTLPASGSEEAPFKIEEPKAPANEMPKDKLEEKQGPKPESVQKEKGKDAKDTKDSKKSKDVSVAALKVEAQVAAKGEPKTESKVSTASKLKGWTIQVGSFSNPDNARDLEKKLKLGGFPAYTSGNLTQEGVLIKVMVGPQIKKDDANRLKTKVESKFAVKGLVIPYEPVAG